MRKPTGATSGIEALLQRIRGEFIEMPGLRLTAAQAQRLWALDHASCHTALGALLESGFLTRTADGSFVRAGSISRRSSFQALAVRAAAPHTGRSTPATT